MREMHKKPWVVLSIIVILFSSLNSACAKKFRPPFDPSTPLPEVYDQAVSTIQKYYIDNSGKAIELDTSKRPDMRALISQLDSAELVSWKEYVQYNNPFRADIGLEVSIKNGEIIVKRIFPNSPASECGLRRGDRIIELNGEPVKYFTLGKISWKMCGTPGSELTLKIMNSRHETTEITIPRKIRDVGPTILERILENDLGYIRIARFTPWTDNTFDQVQGALESFQQKKIRGLILDLRRTSGGDLSSAIETAQLFLGKGVPIGSLFVRNVKSEKTFTSRGSPYATLPVAVLVDGETGSLAEILAAVLKEQRNCPLIGERTSGDGQVNSGYMLKDGSFLVLNIHQLYTSIGIKIEGHGMKPDVEVITSGEDKEELYRRIDSYLPANSQDNFRDVQLETAISFMRKSINLSKGGLT